MFVFRVDGNSEIGMGHIMRCLSVANAAKNYNISSVFVLSEDDCSDIIERDGHRVVVLGTEYSEMNSKEILPVIATYSPCALIIDSYFVTINYMKTVSAYCTNMNVRIVYIDDRCQEPYPCNLIVNYNIFANSLDYRLIYQKTNEPYCLLGLEYVPLRVEFQSLEVRNTQEVSKSIFVSTGGADAEHLGVEILKKAMLDKDHSYHFVVGALNNDKRIIQDLASNSGNIVVHEDINNISEVMRSCDVAISAAGSTLYELCATQAPSVTYIVADNQIPAAIEFDARGIMKNCGDVREIGREKLAKRIVVEAMALADNYEERKRISIMMRNLVDGMGASRIVKELLV